MSEGRDRTAEEREAARRERELRRAEHADPIQAVEPDEPPPEPSDELLDDGEFDELPSGIRRVQGRPPGRPSRAPHARAPHSLAGRVLATLALVLAAAVIWFLAELLQPFHGSGHGSVTVTIPPHTGASGVGDLLERDGVVSSSFFFQLRALIAGERTDLRAGRYHLRLGMSYGDALAVLTKVPPAAPVTSLTITEGRTRREIAALLRAQGIRGNYLLDSRRSPLLHPSIYGAPRNTSTLEGFLFPSTYQLREPISAAALVADQLQAFKQNFRTVNLGYARTKHRTPYDVLIVASMVEAEAQTVHDRPLVASVIYNRLRDGMPLQIDATVRYATNNYSAPITVSQLHSPSPYNTYVQKGLPPAPIDNPGLASIEAAAHPATTSYLYFVVKPCGNGEHAFASTYSQFLADANRYAVARTRRGGRSPARC